MNKYDIEKLIIANITDSIEKITTKSIDSINKYGFDFEKDGNQLVIWRDKQKNLELKINPIISVSCKEITEHDVSSENIEQLKIENEFYEIAEQGKDEKADILASFEGEIANGGFEQLFLNKDSEFINLALDIMQTIGAKTKYQLSKEAIQVHQKYSKTITKYNEFQNILSALEDNFQSTKENIPVLYYEKYKV